MSLGCHMRALRMGIALTAVALSFVVAACGNDDSVSQEELDQAVEEAKEEVATESEISKLQQKVRDAKKEAGVSATTTVPSSAGTGSGLPSDAEGCGDGIFVRSGTTSCPFGLNVAADYYSRPGNNFTSYSPATGEAYSISCSGSEPVVCTGGNNAAVYLP